MDELENIYTNILNKIPKDIEFGFISVKNESFKIITLENNFKTNIPISVETNDTFIFSINNGIIPRQGKIEIKITVIPQTAIVSIGNAQIIIGKEKDRKSKIIKLSFISKYPHLKIQKNILDFGNILIGKNKENEIFITNPEKVPASFKIMKKKNSNAKTLEHFFVSETTGIVPPNSQYLLKIKYISSYANHFSYETFEIKTKGGNSIRFSCIANSLGITTNISENFVNFQSVELNTSKTRMIRLFNESDEPTNFQFFYNNETCFKLDELQGVIPANSNVRIRITFQPIETITYYNRIFCITKNHFLFVKLFLIL